MPKVSLDFNTRKDIKVIMLKGERGQSSYQEAVENLLFSGTLEEWIETFATPENYITRTEFQKVTQAQYDELKAQGRLIPNAFYLIIDEPTYAELLSAIDDLGGTNGRVTILETTVGTLETNVGDLSTQLNSLGGRVTDLENKAVYRHTIHYGITVYNPSTYDEYITVFFSFETSSNVAIDNLIDLKAQIPERTPLIASGYKEVITGGSLTAREYISIVIDEGFGYINMLFPTGSIALSSDGTIVDAVTRIY